MVKIMRKMVCFVFMGAVLCSGYGSVLCYGGDGHVAIEPFFHNCCDHDDVYEYGPADQALPAAVVSDSCNPCEDIAMGTDREPVRLHDSTPFAPVGFTVLFSDVLIAAGDILDQHSNTCAFFGPLKTIRLLI